MHAPHEQALPANWLYFTKYMEWQGKRSSPRQRTSRLFRRSIAPLSNDVINQ